MTKRQVTQGKTTEGAGGRLKPSERIERHIAGIADWRGEKLAKIRKLIHDVDPEVVEEIKWRKPSNPAGVPVWSHDGIICTGETYQNHVRLTFAEGASLRDPKGIFNASLEGNALRAVVLHEDDKIDDKAFTALIRSTIALNTSSH